VSNASPGVMGNTSGKRKQLRKRPNALSGKKLTPIEHAKAQFELSNPGSTNKSKRIFQKKDLVDAVRKVQTVRCNTSPQTTDLISRDPSKSSILAEPEVRNPASREVEFLEEGVNHNARKFNDMKMMADKKQQELDKLIDIHKELKMENHALSKIKNKQTTDATKIGQLTKEIEKVQIDMENKMFVRKQLEHMTRRLTGKQFSYDSHINSMEEALQASTKEYEEVKLLMSQLEVGKTNAMIQMQQTKQDVEAQLKQQMAELNERQQEAGNAKRMEQWRDEREKQRQELAAELLGDLSKEEEMALLEQLKTREMQTQELIKQNKERAHKAMTLEEAFLQIRQATGVSTLEEMVEKFMGQESNKNALQEEKEEAEARLQRAKEKKAVVLQQFAEMKATGIGSTELNREVYDKLDEEILQMKAELKVAMAASERLNEVLVAVRQGALGLVQRLQPFTNVLDPHDDLHLSQNSGFETLDWLHLAEGKLSKMVEILAQQTGLQGHSQHGNELDGDGEDMSGRPEEDERMRSWTPMLNDDPTPHTNNIRVRSTYSTILAQESEEGKVSFSASFGANESFAEQDVDDDEGGADDLIPSRDFLKQSCTRQLNDISRKQEQMEKRKKMMEGMKDENGNINLTSSLVRKKQQAKASDRLAMQPSSKKTVASNNKKEDAISRSQAFLTQTDI